MLLVPRVRQRQSPDRGPAEPRPVEEMIAETAYVDTFTTRTYPSRPALMKFKNLTSMLRSRYGPHSKEVEPNHWMFEVLTGENRSQVVHLICKEQNVNGRDMSRIIADSPIGPVPPRADYETLLRKNANLDVGAICIEDFRDEENQLVSYFTLRASHLVSTADFEEIFEMVEKVSRVADRLERDIYASDLH